MPPAEPAPHFFRLTADGVETSRLLLRVAEACETLSYKASKVWELIAQGELETVGRGRATRIPVESVASYVKRLREGSAR